MVFFGCYFCVNTIHFPMAGILHYYHQDEYPVMHCTPCTIESAFSAHEARVRASSCDNIRIIVLAAGTLRCEAHLQQERTRLEQRRLHFTTTNPSHKADTPLTQIHSPQPTPSPSPNRGTASPRPKPHTSSSHAASGPWPGTRPRSALGPARPCTCMSRSTRGRARRLRCRGGFGGGGRSSGLHGVVFVS